MAELPILCHAVGPNGLVMLYWLVRVIAGRLWRGLVALGATSVVCCMESVQEDSRRAFLDAIGGDTDRRCDAKSSNVG